MNLPNQNQTPNGGRRQRTDSTIVNSIGVVCGSVLIALSGCSERLDFSEPARNLPVPAAIVDVAAPKVAVAAKPAPRKRRLLSPIQRRSIVKRAVAKKKTASSIPLYKKRPIETGETKPAPRVVTLNWWEEALAAWDAQDSAAIEAYQPIRELLVRGLAEASLVTEVDSMTSPVQLDLETVYGTVAPLEPRFEQTVGSFQQNHFPQIRERFAAIRSDLGMLKRPLKAPTSRSKRAMDETIVVAPQPAPVSPVKKEMSIAAAPKISERKRAPERTPSADVLEPIVTATLAAPIVALSTASKVVEPLTEIAAPPTTVVEAVPPPVPRVFDASKELAADNTPAPMPTLSTAVVAPPALVVSNTPMGPLPRVTTATTQPVVSQPERSAATTPSEAEQEFGTRLAVQLILSEKSEKSADGNGEDLATWLERVKGHIEVRLHPVGSTERADTIYLTCSAEYECGYDTSELRGSYRMIASVFTADDIFAYGEAQYGPDITAENAKQHIRFEIKKSEIKRLFTPPTAKAEELAVEAKPAAPFGPEAPAPKRAPLEHVELMVTVFEAVVPELDVESIGKSAETGFSQPKPIVGAKIRLVGYPEIETQKTDALGTLKFSNVSTRSQYLIYAEAPGYLPAYERVSVFTTHASQRIYLIPQKYQKAPFRDRALVLGRSLDPVSRQPIAKQRIEMRLPAAATLRLDADSEPLLPETSQNGLFGWMGTRRGFRSADRGAGLPLFSFFARSGSGNYFEFNRGGEKTLFGQFVDASTGAFVSPQVKLLGQDSSRAVVADAQGRFQIPGIGFPSGVVSIQAAAVGYRTTIHTIPWDVVERDRMWKLPMVAETELEAAVSAAARAAAMPADRTLGILAGDASGAFLNNQVGCLRVELVDGNGTVAPATMGPFPLRGQQNLGAPLCVNREQNGFVFINLPDGEYSLRWIDSSGDTPRNRLVHVLGQHVSMIRN